MIEEWRLLLYYPLGLLPSLFFGLRFFVQWIQSEKAGNSIVTPLFWRLSLIGNILLMLHYLIQVQYPFCLLQGSNAVISWRNLNLMQSPKPCSSKTALVLFCSSFLVVTCLFLAQSHWVIGELDWIRTPVKLFDANREHHSLSWHLFGVAGQILFTSRFWLQWRQAEKMGASGLNQIFWRLSIAGSLLSLIYFVRIHDSVSIFNISFSLIPYIRNLMLFRRQKA